MAEAVGRLEKFLKKSKLNMEQAQLCELQDIVDDMRLAAKYDDFDIDAMRREVADLKKKFKDYGK